jgi:guanosine-3',5'-bis(diphosphate) 3'-pyrophosphohydrolase
MKKDIDLEVLAKKLAKEAHEGVLRKDFDNVPYITHPVKVAQSIEMFFPEDSALIAACLCHDVLEDCDVEWHMVMKLLGDEAFNIVKEVTNPSKRFPELSRQEKKKMDREHIATISYRAKCLKLADRTDNLIDACQSPRRNWVRTYVEESMLLYTALVGTHFALEVRFLEALSMAGKGCI